MLEKQFLRKAAINLRKSLGKKNKLSEISECIVKRILNSDDFKNAKNIALYYPLENEVDITKIVNAKNKNFYFPRCKGDNLVFAKYTDFSNFKTSRFNLREPVSEPIDAGLLDIIYIPALVASKDCYRLGWGKGYYDKFFNKYKPKAKKIIVAPKILILDNMSVDKHDVKCDLLICED